MKLFTDEESDYMCRDSRPVPMELRQEVFDMLIDDEHISKFNHMKKKTEDFKKSYHTPANINIYCNAVCAREGLNPVEFLKEYNQVYDKMVKDEIKQEIMKEPVPFNTDDIEKLAKEYTANAMGDALNIIAKQASRKKIEDVEVDLMGVRTKAEMGQYRRRHPDEIYNVMTGEYETINVEEDREMDRMREAMRDL